jgi:hypothetical protein
VKTLEMLMRLLAALLLATACASPRAVASSTPSVSLAAASPSPSPTASPTPTATPSPTERILSIFDAHLHYSREIWGEYPPWVVANLLETMHVQAALVSSAPDEGTFRLREALGDRVIPILSPYRNGADVFGWTRDGTILPYLRSAYRPGAHRGFGEFHLSSGQIGLPVVQSVLAFAKSQDLFLQPHADTRALTDLLSDVGPEYTVLWAHAGVTATPDQVDALLDRWPKLWVELSLRDDVAPSDRLDPRWRALFLKYPDRFMVGTDTWTVGGSYTGNERWHAYGEIVGRIRMWLDQLPYDVAVKIAHANAERFLAKLPQ